MQKLVYFHCAILGRLLCAAASSTTLSFTELTDSLINELFSPSEEETAYAAKLVDDNREMLMKGTAVFVFEGKMIDSHINKAADKVLAKAKLAGLLKTEE